VAGRRRKKIERRGEGKEVNEEAFSFPFLEAPSKTKRKKRGEKKKKEPGIIRIPPPSSPSFLRKAGRGRKKAKGREGKGMSAPELSHLRQAK